MASPESTRRRHWGFVNAMPAPLLSMIAKQAEAQGLVGLFAPPVYGPPFIPLAGAKHAQKNFLRKVFSLLAVVD